MSDALQLLADDGHVTIRQWRGNSFATYQKGMNWGSFIYQGGNFELKPNAAGRRRHEELASRRFRDLGASGANKVVRDTLVKLQDVLSGCGDLSFASLSIRILEELVRIGVRNYQDSRYLRDPAQRYLEVSGSHQRQDCETHFYQPFLADALQRDEILAGHVVLGASTAFGNTDLMTVYHIPIEAKVIYPNDQRQEDLLSNMGVGQATQYASLSRLAFLSILDLRPRSVAADLSNIQNDVVVRSIQQGGSNAVSIVRVQHVCGYGRPSAVK